MVLLQCHVLCGNFSDLSLQHSTVIIFSVAVIRWEFTIGITANMQIRLVLFRCKMCFSLPKRPQRSRSLETVLKGKNPVL